MVQQTLYSVRDLVSKDKMVGMVMYAYNANNVPPNLLEETVAGLSLCSTIILLFYEDCKNMESNLIYFMSLILDLVLCLTSGVLEL